MNFKLKLFFLFAMILTVLTSCHLRNKRPENLAPNAHIVTAKEVLQTSNYTYVRVTDEDKEYWLAIDKAEINEGTTYYWSQGMEMNNFTSKELKRTFPSIFFIQDFTDQPILTSKQLPALSTKGKQQIPEKPGIKVPRAEDGVTIAELYEKKMSFSGKTIKIRGEVVKFSSGIMKKNWVHLQDGTKYEGKFDLTLSTIDFVKVGDIVLFEGVVALDKDFGYGYFYDVIVENAVVKK